MRTQHLILASLFAASTLNFVALAQPAAPKEGEPAREKNNAPEGQPTRPRAGAPRANALAPEKAKAAWEAQAIAVAKRNKLGDDQSKTLVTAYSAARASHQTATQKLRDDSAAKGGGGGGPEAAAEMMTAQEDLIKAEKAKFEKALTGFNPAEVTKVSTSLGTFNRQWDGLTNFITEMKLDSDKQLTASDAIEDFVVSQTQIRARGGADVDRETIAAAMQESRKKLTDSLAKVLTEEQAKSFEENLGRARGRGQGGGGAGGGRPPAPPAGDKKPDSPK